MKIRGGHMPKIAGRPVSVVEDVSLPGTLRISLERQGVVYSAVVKNGQKIKFGDTLAEAAVKGGRLALPAPADGRVTIERTGEKTPKALNIETSGNGVSVETHSPLKPERVSAEKVRDMLAGCGVWPFFWSSRTGGAPTLENSERPRAIIVNSVLAEPFRTRGKVILQRSWDLVIQGMRFFPRLLADYGTTEIILTEKRDPVAQRLYQGLTGYAWLHFHPVPVRYPVENPIVLNKALRKHDDSIKKEDVIWIIDMQGVEALGACLAESLPLHKRIVAVGGPGHPDPKHMEVRIGTPVRSIMPNNINIEDTLVLRGGLLKGEPVDVDTDAVEYDDDAFFLLPKMKDREFLSFTRPGFRRTSMLPCFMSMITGAADSDITTSLRGERRPCIACGLCEVVCPAGLLPQVIHRYLYREDYEKAEAMGLDLCIDCGLCTYVCPSKIELQKQFIETSLQLGVERGEAQVSKQT